MKIHLNNLPESLLHAEREAQTLFQQLVSSGVYEPIPQPSPLGEQPPIDEVLKVEPALWPTLWKALAEEDVNPAFF